MEKLHLHACNKDNYKKAQDLMPGENIIENLSTSFKVFADPTRLKILFALKEVELCVCDLAQLLNMSQSSISHQLKTLRDEKLVKARREGKFMVYSLDDDHVYDIIQIATAHIMEDM